MSALVIGSVYPCQPATREERKGIVPKGDTRFRFSLFLWGDDPLKLCGGQRMKNIFNW